MKPSTELFKLVKSLTKSEKRFFKLSSSLQSGEKNYLKIFDYIERQSSYDENALKSELRLKIQETLATLVPNIFGAPKCGPEFVHGVRTLSQLLELHTCWVRELLKIQVAAFICLF